MSVSMQMTFLNCSMESFLNSMREMDLSFEFVKNVTSLESLSREISVSGYDEEFLGVCEVHGRTYVVGGDSTHFCLSVDLILNVSKSIDDLVIGVCAYSTSSTYFLTLCVSGEIRRVFFDYGMADVDAFELGLPLPIEEKSEWLFQEEVISNAMKEYGFLIGDMRESDLFRVHKSRREEVTRIEKMDREIERYYAGE